mmetsp:Transcript_36790/g.45960  ORF Transcript_36790/g.45960 Transcript_36790/m.45960 type:complete len:330 (+) Transcript_36790:1524-2513(+)
MIKAFKIMFPDLANEIGRHMHTYIHTYIYTYIQYIGRKVCWITDFHNSRFDLNLLDQCAKAGIVLLGWIPNTTSYCQSPDVNAFGPFKAIREYIESVEFSGKKVGRLEKIQIACRSLPKAFTQANTMNGLRDSGIFPFNRHVLTDLAVVKQGDRVRQLTNAASGTWIHKQITNLENTPSTTPKEMAKIKFDELSKKKPRLGPNLILYDEGTPNRLSKARNNLIHNLERLKELVEPDLRLKRIQIKEDFDNTAKTQEAEYNEAVKKLTTEKKQKCDEALTKYHIELNKIQAYECYIEELEQRTAVQFEDLENARKLIANAIDQTEQLTQK